MKVVLTLSGGLDSTVLLWALLKDGCRVKCLSVDYGQRHVVELKSAAAVAALAQVEHRIVDLTSLREIMGGSSLTRDDISVPEGHYEDESMKLTIVPNRNMILLAVATAWAVSLKYTTVAY